MRLGQITDLIPTSDRQVELRKLKINPLLPPGDVEVRNG
jgi:hypothetical protein